MPHPSCCRARVALLEAAGAGPEPPEGCVHPGGLTFPCHRYSSCVAEHGSQVGGSISGSHAPCKATRCPARSQTQGQQHLGPDPGGGQGDPRAGSGRRMLHSERLTLFPTVCRPVGRRGLAGGGAWHTCLVPPRPAPIFQGLHAIHVLTLHSAHLG